MERERLIGVLSGDLPEELARDLVDSFLALRQDLATKTYGRAAPGKFVETFVQVLQYLGDGSCENHPKVEAFLAGRVEQDTALDDGLRICGARVGRAMYALRNKRISLIKARSTPIRMI